VSPARLLDSEVLRRFDQALSVYAPAVRAPLAHPGVGRDEVQERFVAVGLRPSREALEWWTYFDAPVGASGLEVLPRCWFLTVSQSVDLRRWRRELAEEAANDAGPGHTVDDAYGDQWIPLFSIQNEGDVVLDCSDGLDIPSPVREMYPDTVFSSEHGRMIAPSLGEFLLGAIHWMEQGHSRWDPGRRQWWPTESWAMKDRAELFRTCDR
jgi:hypothetical protein